MSAPALAVTGSTGALGGMIARDLADRGVAQRLLARDPDRAPQLPGAVAVRSTYEDSEAVRDSLAGVTTLLMVSAAENEHRLAQHLGFVDAAVAAGVGHVVYTSFFGASPTCTFTLGRDHDATERAIVASGIAYTFLRDNLYLDFMDALVGEDGVIRGPAGAGRVAAVAREDVARAAVAVLVDPAAHSSATYDMTGREALTMSEVAAVLAAHRGAPVVFHDETLPEAYESRKRWAAPAWQVDAWVSTYTAIAAGELEGVSDDVTTLTGRAPLTLRELLAQG